MSRKHFSALLISALLVVIAIALLVPERTGHNGLPESDLIFPGLQGRINDANHVTVTAGGNRVVATLERGETDWTVRELGGYPARWAVVRDLLAGLARARVIEIKTDNPEYYDRLGVEDVADEGAGGLEVTIDMGEERVAVIIGRNAERRDGRYLRPADAAQSVLSDFDATVADKAVGWVEREVVDIPSADVAEVDIRHTDGERIKASKASPEDPDFTLDNLPEGRELKSSWAVNSLGGVLAGLQLDAVASEDVVDWSEAARISLRTFAGMQIEVEAVLEGEDHWVRLAAASAGGDDSAPPAGDEPTAEETDEEEPGEMAAFDEEPIEDTSSLQSDIEAFNARVRGWAYQIPAYKFEAMTKRLEDLLKPEEEASD